MVLFGVYGFGMSEAHDAPPLAPNLDDVLDDAERMLGAMASRALPAVAEVAGILATQARGAGATDIAEAAENVRQEAREHNTVALAKPMRRLAEVIAAERRRHGEISAV
jgi:methyl coenzyme M reductase subunit C-like uncharacterized protein (methanogenesis marker protein 7)